MTLTLKPLHPLFTAEADGVDLKKPLDADTVREIDAAMDRYAVLVFRGQPLDQGEQIAFSRQFGPLDAGLRKATGAPTRFKYDELIDIGNVALDGSVAERGNTKLIGVLANQLWHADSSAPCRRGRRFSLPRRLVANRQLQCCPARERYRAEGGCKVLPCADGGMS